MSAREAGEALAALRELAEARPGQRLPSERALAAQAGVTRAAVRLAISELQSEGLVETRRGSGTYAVDPAQESVRQACLLVDRQLKLGDDPFYSLLFEQLQRALQQAGVAVTVERIDEDDRTSGERMVRRAVITLGRAGSAFIGRLRPSEAAVVGMLLPGSVLPGRRVSIFRLDDRGAGAQAARRLAKAGCRRGYFLGRPDIDASRERWEGARDAAGTQGLELRLVECHLNYGAGLQAGRALAREAAFAGAGIIATNDWLAVGVRAGLEGAANAIVSFDGLALANDPALRIDSLAVPVAEIAGDAVAELQRLAKARDGAPGRAISYSLTWRDQA